MVRVIFAVTGILALTACAGPGAPTADPSPTTTSIASERPTPAFTASATPTPTPTPSAPTSSSKTATLKTTTDSSASITYTQNGSEVREDISGPWEKTVELTDSSNTLTLTVVSTGGRSNVGCEIRAEGILIKNMSSGAPATTRCNATIS